MPDHGQSAVRALERADYIANADNWPSEGRSADVANELARAQVHATLAVAEAIDDLRRVGLPVERV